MRIVHYALKVSKNGFWLDAAEAFLYSVVMKKNLAVIEDCQRDLSPQPMLSFITSLLSVDAKLDEELKSLDVCGPDHASGNTWLCIAVNANYEPGQRQNHWIPGFFKDEMTPEQWFAMTHTQNTSLYNERLRLEGLLKQLEGEAGSETDKLPPTRAATLRSKVQYVSDQLCKCLGIHRWLMLAGQSGKSKSPDVHWHQSAEYSTIIKSKKSATKLTVVVPLL